MSAGPAAKKAKATASTSVDACKLVVTQLLPSCDENLIRAVFDPDRLKAVIVYPDQKKTDGCVSLL